MKFKGFESFRNAREGTQDRIPVDFGGPAGFFCLLTALRFHQLTTQNPAEVWIALPEKARKAGRLVELQRTFWSSPGRVLSTEELANRIDVAPRTVRKYLKELSASGSLPIYREGRGWKLAEDARMEILPVRFQLEEAVAVYLAARLLLRSGYLQIASTDPGLRKLRISEVRYLGP